MPTNFKARAKRQKISLRQRYDNFMSRRPHRSFRLTRRRDYAKALKLPGYISFGFEVVKTINKYKKVLLPLSAVYIIINAVLVGLVSQDIYTQLSDTVASAGSQIFGSADVFTEALGSFFAIATLAGGAASTEFQQVATVVLFISFWLSVVWLLRNLIAGNRVRMRDGLYNAGAPLIASFVVMFIMGLQLLPVVVAMMAYGAAITSGLLAGGAPAMLFWLSAALLGVLSAYWLTSSVFALIIVTIPGMYPWRAIRSAGDMVQGVRLRILFRWIFMITVVALVYVAVLLPAVLIESWLRTYWPWLENVPVIPVLISVLTTAAALWCTSYVYLLYRKVVENAER